MYRIVQKVSSKSDFYNELEEELADYEIENYSTTKEKRGAKVHKKRYKNSSTHTDFD